MPQRQIELRQQKTNIVNNNGDFNVNLKEPLYIYEGDTIEIKNAFIDTRKTSAEGTINISNDINVELDIYKYIVSHTAENGIDADADRGRDYYGKQKADHPTGRKYIVCKASGTSANLVRVSSLNFLVSNLFPNVNEPFRTETVYFTYVNASGEPSNFSITISKSQAEGWFNQIGKTASTKYSLVVNFPITPIVIQPQSLGFAFGTDIWGKAGIASRQKWFWDPVSLNNNNYVKVPSGSSDSPFESTQISIADSYKPYSEKLQFTVPAGQYTPDNLANFITKNLSIITDNKIDIQNGKTLTTCGRFDKDNYAFVSETGDDYFEVGSDNKFWIGSNQISLEYNPQLSKFEFDYLHMPFYSEITQEGITNGAIVNKIINTPERGDIIIGSAAGILINNWTSSFFEDILGFDGSILTQPTDYKEISLSGNNVHAPVFNLTDGVNITSGFAGLDTVIAKRTNTWFLLSSLSNLESTTDVTSSIIANNVIQPQQEEKFAYFNVLLNAGFKTDYINSENIKRNINCIVSKYYSVDSYTIFEGQGVVYQHKGQPQMLSEMGVRVLDPDFNVPDIGEDNTIILLLNQNI